MITAGGGRRSRRRGRALDSKKQKAREMGVREE
jgi:hypothetical protein